MSKRTSIGDFAVSKSTPASVATRYVGNGCANGSQYDHPGTDEVDSGKRRSVPSTAATRGRRGPYADAFNVTENCGGPN